MSYYLAENRTGGLVANGLARLEGVPVQGFRVVEVPDSVAIDEEVLPGPLTLPDLVQQTYMFQLAATPQFSEVAWEDLTDPSTAWDLTPPATRASVGVGVAWLPPVLVGDPGLLTTATVLTSNPFNRVRVLWTAYALNFSQGDALRADLQFDALPPDVLLAEVSNDGGLTWFAVPAQGVDVTLGGVNTQLALRWSNFSATDRVYIGSWGALLGA
jgi:hypothetical protein